MSFSNLTRIKFKFQNSIRFELNQIQKKKTDSIRIDF